MGFTATLWIGASSPATLIQSYRSMLKIISPGPEAANDDNDVISLAQPGHPHLYSNFQQQLGFA
jgi:hypothetical protein